TKFQKAHGTLWQSLELWPAIASWGEPVDMCGWLRKQVCGWLLTQVFTQSNDVTLDLECRFLLLEEWLSWLLECFGGLSSEPAQRKPTHYHQGPLGFVADSWDLPCFSAKIQFLLDLPLVAPLIN
ncbi:mCG146107, partial [Mus musculus]